jgi:hypothetical protein
VSGGVLSLCERQRRRRILDVRAADLQEELAEQRFSVPPDLTKTAATQRTSERAERAIEHGAMREQLTRIRALRAACRSRVRVIVVAVPDQ